MAKISRALISVSNKQGIIELARGLRELGVEILSTGGTAKLLREQQIPIQEVSEYTGFPEIMGGRVKTLHPKIHGGILGRRGIDDATMATHGIAPIDLIVVNLYPFEQTVADPECALASAIEQIDIGGPTMLRAAAKNYKDVAVVVEHQDYPNLLEELRTNAGVLSADTHFRLAAQAFAHTAQYDDTIANYLGTISPGAARAAFPKTLNIQVHQAQGMRYGENPHQGAAFYKESGVTQPCIATARQLQGKELSYNNIADADAALECVKTFHEAPACVIVKHANPCGVAFGQDLLEAYDRAFRTDPESAFGGIIALNKTLDASTAKAILERQFVEVIIAPEVREETLETLATKKNVRVLACGYWSDPNSGGLDFKRVVGGLLVQHRDLGLYKELRVATQRMPSEQEMKDLLFTWRVSKFVKSNAIVYGKDLMTIGVGAGQMSRVNSARIAAVKAQQAGLEVKGSVMASDAFFPFRDGIDSAAKAGITAVIQPGGSVRDDEVIEAANEHSMAMVFTGMRHFRH